MMALIGIARPCQACITNQNGPPMQPQLAVSSPQGEASLACSVPSLAAQSRDTSELSLLDRCGTVCASRLAPGRLPLATSCLHGTGRCQGFDV